MSCKIYLDPGPYYSGSEVRGRLECHFMKSEKIRGIKIRTSGDEHTEWIRTETEYDERTKRHEVVNYPCNGDNNLFSFEIMLFGGDRGESHVGPGNMNYPFSFLLPANLPSTFMNDHGYIRYTLTGIVDVPWGLDYEDKIFYEVQSLIDLNTFPMECFQPVSRSDNKTVCCWCCAQGDITLDININKSAFVPGEKVKLYMTLTNMSNSNVEGVSAKFMQYVKSKVEHPRHEYKENEYEFGFNTWSGVGAHGENKYDMELLIPPEAPFPNLNRSSLFEISYDVEICAAIDGCHSNMDLSFSIEIGHIQHQSQLDPNAPSVDGNAQVYPSNPPSYPSNQPGYPSGEPGYQIGQPGYPNNQPGYPSNQPGYPSNQPGYPSNQPGIPSNQPGYPSNQPGFPSNQPGFPSSQPGFPNSQPGYPSSTPIYPNPAAGQPTAPLINFGGPNPGIPYPQGPQLPNPSGPPFPAASNSGITSPPDYVSVYPGGPPEIPPSMNSKEKQSLNEGKEVPSAPPSTDELPPSYEVAFKNEKK